MTSIQHMEQEGWSPRWVDGWNRFAAMHPRTGTIYYLSRSADNQFITLALDADRHAAVFTTNDSLEPWETN